MTTLLSSPFLPALLSPPVLPARFRGLILAMVLCAGFAMMLSLAGCGRRTAPHPAGPSFPPTGAVKVWQREGRILVAWLMPASPVVQRLGGLDGFEVRVERLPLDCFACGPDSVQRVRLAPDAPELHVEAGRVFYGFPLPAEPAVWRITVRTRFEAGSGAPSTVKVLEGIARVPAPELEWSWAEGATPSQASGDVVLFWKQRRERIVQVISEGGVVANREQFFRANVYRRRSGEPWPFLPLNEEPLRVRRWTVPAARIGPDQPPVEFTLRLVDQFGNEGPVAPPVIFPPTSARP